MKEVVPPAEAASDRCGWLTPSTCAVPSTKRLTDEFLSTLLQHAAEAESAKNSILVHHLPLFGSVSSYHDARFRADARYERLIKAWLELSCSNLVVN